MKKNIIKISLLSVIIVNSSCKNETSPLSNDSNQKIEVPTENGNENTAKENNLNSENSENSNRIWSGEGSDGSIITFKKSNSDEWIEMNGTGTFRYIETKKEGKNNYTLKDINRAGVYINLTNKACYYKDKNTDWVQLYKGNWEE